MIRILKVEKCDDKYFSFFSSASKRQICLKVETFFNFCESSQFFPVDGKRSSLRSG